MSCTGVVTGSAFDLAAVMAPSDGPSGLGHPVRHVAYDVLDDARNALFVAIEPWVADW